MEDFNFIDPSGHHWENKYDWLFNELIGGCACGNSEKIAEDVYKVFVSIAEERDDRYKTIYKSRYHELIAHVFDSRGITEHGSSVGGSWLTEKGQKIYNYLIAYEQAQKES